MKVSEIEMRSYLKGWEVEVCDVNRYLETYGGFFFEIRIKTLCDGAFESRTIVGAYTWDECHITEEKQISAPEGQHRSLELEFDVDVDRMLIVIPTRDCQLHIEKVDLLPFLVEDQLKFEAPIESALIRTLREAPSDSEEFRQALLKLNPRKPFLSYLPSIAAILLAVAAIFAVIKL